MKRCHRFTESQPYRPFSFEQSLRKYEKAPSKKVKTESKAYLKNSNGQDSKPAKKDICFESITSSIDDKQIDERCHDFQINERPNSEKIEQEIHLLNHEPTNSLPNEKGIQHYQMQEDNLFNAFKDDGGFGQSCNSRRQTQRDPKQSPLDSGRFHLNHNVSISSRILEKLLRQNEVDSIVGQLLRKRAYLLTEKEEIQTKFKSFLANRQ